MYIHKNCFQEDLDLLPQKIIALQNLTYINFVREAKCIYLQVAIVLKHIEATVNLTAI